MFVIAGPCVIESESLTFEIAEKLGEIAKRKGFEFYFKASFDKANRSSIGSFRGPGIEEGSRILRRIKNELGLKIITDIHEPWQADYIKDYVDIIQIPAFLSRQTDLIVSAAKTGKIVNVKKGQFMSPLEALNIINKIESAGNNNIFLTERGSSFGYNSLVVDMTSIIEMKKFGYPVIFDATHSVQRPGSEGTSTGGNKEYIFPLSRAAVAVGIDGIFVEVHPNPNMALSDGANSLDLASFELYIESLIKLNEYHNKVY
jgi:2-dehydro-3-deoxyphosphooctonate aldolase (KDO 8-P synthase)